MLANASIQNATTLKGLLLCAALGRVSPRLDPRFTRG